MTWTSADHDQAVRDGAVLVDVRTHAEHEAGAIPGSLHIPVDELRSRLDEILADRPVVVYCQAGMRGHTAARILEQHGRDVRNLDGGWLTWRAGQSTRRGS